MHFSKHLTLFPNAWMRYTRAKDLLLIEIKSPVQNDSFTSKHYYFKTQLTHYIWISVYSFHYNDLTINWYDYVTVVLLLKHSFMGNYEQHYESEATEDWVCSGMISFNRNKKDWEKITLILFDCYEY